MLKVRGHSRADTPNMPRHRSRQHMSFQEIPNGHHSITVAEYTEV